MSTVDREALKARLRDAEAAYHRLLTGQSVVEFRDQNGELIRYSAIQSSRLMGYILDLKRQLGLVNGHRPMRAFF